MPAHSSAPPPPLTPHPHEEPVALLWAALVGAAGALATLAFRLAVAAVERLLTGSDGSRVTAALQLDWSGRLVVPAAGALLAGLLLQLERRLRRPGEVTDYMAAIDQGSGAIASRPTLLRAAASLWSIGSGGSIGREGAMVQLAAWSGSLAGLVRFAPPRNLLVACGASSGLAAAYNAPVAAALFVAELVPGAGSLPAIAPLMMASVVASAVVHLSLGSGPVFAIPLLAFTSHWELFSCAALGLILGAAAAAWTEGLDRAKGAYARLDWPLWARLALGGAIVGAISVVEPRVWGNGNEVVNELFARGGVWTALTALLALKVLATLATAGSGAVGGVFTPTLFIGAALGWLAGVALNAASPVAVSPPAVYAAVGMGAMLAGSTQAPLMATVMLFELTLDYRLVPAFMLAGVCADLVANRLGAATIYAQSAVVHRGPAVPGGTAE